MGDGEDTGSGGLVTGLLKKLVLGVVLLVVLVGLLWLVGILRTPGVEVVDSGDWGNVSEETTEIETTVAVRSPFAFDVSFGGAKVDYALYMNEVRMAEGNRSGIHLQPGTHNKTLTTRLDNSKLDDWWRTYVRRNETIDLRVDGEAKARLLFSASRDFSFERTLLENATPMVSAMSGAAAGAEGQYPEATPIYEVERGWATWGEVTENRTNLRFHFRIRNPNPTPVPAPIRAFDASVQANGVRLLYTDDGSLFKRVSGADSIPGGETREFTVTVAIDNRKIDDWFTEHVRRGEVTDLSVEMEFALGERRIPVPAVSYDCQLRTGILVDDQGTATNCGELGPGNAGVSPADGDGGSTTGDATDEVTNGTDDVTGGVTNDSDGVTGGVTNDSDGVVDDPTDNTTVGNATDGVTALDEIAIE